DKLVTGVQTCALPISQRPAALAEAVTTRPYSKWFEPHPGLGISLMDHLFNRLDGAYPHKWRANFPDPQSVDNWQESWVEAFEERSEERRVGKERRCGG